MGQYFDAGYMIRSFPVLVGYVHITVFITLIAAILGIILGSIIAIVRIKKTLVISQLLRIFMFEGHHFWYSCFWSILVFQNY